MKKYYRDFYGSSASITENRDGTFTLIVRDYHGYMVINKEYNTFRGARIALGRHSDGWRDCGDWACC